MNNRENYEARDIAGGANKVVAVIGDASLAGGMAFEALNHIGQDQTRMVIVLNDNGMSISKPGGALVRHLGYLRTRSEYRQTRDALQQAMEAGGVLSRGLVDLGRNMKESMKQFVIPHAMIFEQLGITCTAPVDGHDVAALRQMFRIALESDGPVLVHVITQKGHGYGPSEANPETFHGVSPFDIATGLERWFDASECGFAYRWSRFKGDLKNRYLIDRVVFRLESAFRPLLSYKALAAALAA